MENQVNTTSNPVHTENSNGGSDLEIINSLLKGKELDQSMIRKMLEGKVDERSIDLFIEGKVMDPTTFSGLRDHLKSVFSTLKVLVGSSLSPADRRRMHGPGISRFGFYQKVLNVSIQNLQFAPPYYGDGDLNNILISLDDYQQLQVLINEVQEVCVDLIIKMSHKAEKLALLYYNSVKQMAKAGVPGAESTFDELKVYFEKNGVHTPDEPTRKELNTDVHGLERGTKEGEIVIEREAPQTTGGSYKALDNTRSGDTSAAKLKVEE